MLAGSWDYIRLTTILQRQQLIELAYNLIVAGVL